MIGHAMRWVLGSLAAALLLAPLAVVSPTAATGGTPAGTQVGAAATAPMRIGTYNIRADKSLADFSGGVTEFAPFVDVFGMQEIVGLQRIKWVRFNRQDLGIFQAPHILQVPILWNRSAFDFVSGTEYKLADQAQTETGLKKTSYAPVVHLFHPASGQTISVMNVHLIQGAIKGGHKAPGKTQTYAYYVKQVAAMRAALSKEKSLHPTWPVYVLGDFNIGYAADSREQVKALPYHQLSAIHMVANWKGKTLLPTGTHMDESCEPGVKACGAYIDQVWGQAPAVSAKAITTILHSDHYPVTSTYDLDVPLGHVAPQGTVSFSSPNESFREGNKDYEGRRAHCIALTGMLDHGWAKVQATGTATEGKDFTIDVSARNGCVDLYVVPDHVNEGDETVTLSLVDPVNTVVAPLASKTVTLTNDD